MELSSQISAGNASSGQAMVRVWLPVVLWGVLVSTLSTSYFGADMTRQWIVPVLHWLMPGASLATVVTMHFAIRKLAHFTEYAIMFWLLVRGPMRAHPVVALGICAFYAMLDETHQIFVPNRTASVYDVALDCSGALFSHALRNGLAEFI